MPGEPGRNGHDDRLHVRVWLGGASEEEVRARREAAREAAEARAEEREDAADQVQQDLDTAVASELEALAAMDAWDGPPKAAEDPFAPRLRVRTDHEAGHRFLVVGIEKQSPSEEALSLEFRKRLGR